MKLIRNFVLALIFSIAPAGSSLACPACFAASSQGTLRAYYISTLLLSMMPFALIAGFVIVVRRYRLGNKQTASVSNRTET